MMRHIRHHLGLLLFAALPAVADVFTYVDAEGRRVFTDRPQESASRRLEIRTPNAMTGTPASPPASTRPAAPKAQPPYARLHITEPAADATLRDNTGHLAVSLSSEPALRPGDRYRLLVDGAPAGESQTPRIALENLDRGTHQLAAEIVDSGGRRLMLSAAQPVHIIRMSLLQRRQADPCKLADYGVRPECPLAEKPVKKPDIPFVPFI